MSRLAFVEPRTGAIRQQVSLTGVTLARGACFDGAGFWVIDETSSTTWEICYCSLLNNTLAKTYSFPFAVVLTGVETLVLVKSITTDGHSLYISFRVEVNGGGMPPAITYTDYLTKWSKDGGLEVDRFLGISFLTPAYNDLTFDGNNVVAALGSSTSMRQIDPLSLKAIDIAAGFTKSGIAYDGLNFYTQAVGNNQLRQISRDGTLLSSASLSNAAGGLNFGHPEFDQTSMSDFMDGEWVAALYP